MWGEGNTTHPREITKKSDIEMVETWTHGNVTYYLKKTFKKKVPLEASRGVTASEAIVDTK